MKQALILTGWYCKISDHWYSWLKKELEAKGYQVFLPDLPTIHTDLPDMKKQLKFIEDNVVINKDTIIFGHSIGSLLALRLAEKHQYKKMFLVAGWDFNDLTVEHRLFWPNPINHKNIKHNVKQIYCLSSDNDPYFTPFTVEQMSQRLGGKFILVKDAGHFTSKFGVKQIPEILKLL